MCGGGGGGGGGGGLRACVRARVGREGEFSVHSGKSWMVCVCVCLSVLSVCLSVCAGVCLSVYICANGTWTPQSVSAWLLW